MSAAGSVCRAVRFRGKLWISEKAKESRRYMITESVSAVSAARRCVEEGNQSEVDEKQIIKSAIVYRIAMVFSQNQDRGKPDNYQKAHNRG